MLMKDVCDGRDNYNEYLEIVYLQMISTQQNWDEILVNLNY